MYVFAREENVPNSRYFGHVPFVQNGPSHPGGHLHTNDVLPLSLTQCPLFWHLNSVQGTCLLHESPVNSFLKRNVWTQLSGVRYTVETYLKTVAVWLHVHVQPTAAAVVTQVSTARRPVAVRDVPARGDRRMVQRYRLVVDRQSSNAPGVRHRQTGGGPGRHAWQIRKTACDRVGTQKTVCNQRNAKVSDE